MLELFPLEYWAVLGILSLTRLLSCQVVTWYLRKLYFSEQIDDDIVKRQVMSKNFLSFLLSGGVGHVTIVFGIILMFWLTYAYIVPVNSMSATVLYIVRAISVFIVLLEFSVAVVSARMAFYMVRNYRKEFERSEPKSSDIGRKINGNA